MSLSANFQEWCALHGYRAAPTVYLKGSDLDGFHQGNARLVRVVPPDERASRHRNPQRYIVELFRDNELFYPFGATPKSKQELLAAMIQDIVNRSIR